MILLPYKHIVLQSYKGIEEIRTTLQNNTESAQPAIYWRRAFHKAFWGKIGDKEFALRPVVPYWNISPIHIRGLIEESNQNKIKLIITSPYLRILVPLVLITLILLFATYWQNQQYDMILNIGFAVVAGAYIMVMIPFQIQLNKSLKMLKELLQ